MSREITNQELLDRYIHSLKLLLPPDKVHDVAAEIRSNLESLMEDQAAQLGRELNPQELGAILKQHGHPMRVASRYRDPESRGLISPALFPIYWFSLRAAFAAWVTIRVIVAVFEFQGAGSASSILLRFGRDVLVAGFVIGAGVTLLFAAWERREFKFRYSEKWRPESLPPVPQPRSSPQRPAVHILGGMALILFWGMAMSLPALYWVWGGRGVFSASAELYEMRLPLWLLTMFAISQTWLKYTRFAAAEWRRFLRIATNVAAVVIVVLLLRTGDLLVPGPNWDPSEGKSLTTLNQMLSGSLVLVCIWSALGSVAELRRTVRGPGGHCQTAGSVS